jgi:hypothetical protein
MSRASTLARAIGADGALNVADVAGLAAVASSGSASDLSTGTLPIARIADGAVVNAKLGTDLDASKLTAGALPIARISDGAVTAAKLASTAVTDKLGYTPVNKAGDTMTGRLIASAGASISGTVVTSSGGTYCPSTGVFILNLESNFGLFTSGLLIVTGNENGVNQTIRTYSWNLAFYGYSSNTRYVRLKAIDTNQLNNGYGDVYAYIGANAASYTSLDQSASGTATSTSDIYLRNAVGQGCSISYTIWRT